MHAAADAVAHIVAHDGEAVALHIVLHRPSHVGDAVADLCKVERLKEGLSGHFHEFLRLFADLTHGVGPRAVADEALVGRAQIDGHDVPVVHHPLAGDAVDDLLVDRDAGGGGKARIPQAAGLGAGLDDELVHRLVDLPGRHAVADGLTAHGSCAGRDFRGLTHDLDL